MMTRVLLGLLVAILLFDILDAAADYDNEYYDYDTFEPTCVFDECEIRDSDYDFEQCVSAVNNKKKCINEKLSNGDACSCDPSDFKYNMKQYYIGREELYCHSTIRHNCTITDSCQAQFASAFIFRDTKLVLDCLKSSENDKRECFRLSLLLWKPEKPGQDIRSSANDLLQSIDKGCDPVLYAAKCRKYASFLFQLTQDVQPDKYLEQFARLEKCVYEQMDKDKSCDGVVKVLQTFVNIFKQSNVDYANAIKKSEELYQARCSGGY
eukprot:GHVU01098772.1.p1 GENE.GHVU01098772.1~~GHVU01098772.1.p1  ORF type:complete len:266 (+),score=26.39 GHVU01098772.1:130-927(+)